MADRFDRGNTAAGDVYTPVPQLTLEAAQNYAAFDAAQQKQVVDRQAYWQQQQQQQAEEARRLEEELKRQQMIDQQRAEQRQMELEAQQMDARLKTRQQQAEALASQEGRQALQGAVEYGVGVGEQGLAQRLQQQNSVLSTGGQPLARNVAEDVLQSREASITDSPLYKAARYDIPYADEVASKVGDAAGAIAKASPQLGLANAVTENTPLGSMFGKDTSTSNIAGTIAETLVPREAWEAALTLIPAYKARTVGELLAAVTIGDIDAMRAVKSVTGLADNEILAGAKRMLASERGSLGRQLSEKEWIAEAQKKGRLFHGSAADPNLGRASSGDESGFFTVEEPSVADFYANSDIRNAEGGKGRLYAADPPKRPLDYASDAKGMDALYQRFKRDADHLDDRYMNYGDVKPPGSFVRAVDAIPGAIASGDVKRIDSAFRNASMEHQRMTTGSFVGAGGYLNKALKDEGYDAFVTLEKNPSLGPDAPYHRVVAYVDRPKLTSYQDYVRARRASERGSLTLGGDDAAKAAAGAGDAALGGTSLPGAADNLPLPPQAIPASVTKMLTTRKFKPNPEQWAVLPPTYKKLITAMADVALNPEDRKLANQALRARQAAKAEAAYDAADTVEEKIAASIAAKQGKRPGSIQAVGERFTALETRDIWDGIDKAVQEGVISKKFEAGTAGSAIKLLLTGERLPFRSDLAKPNHLMPHEIKLLGRIFGPEFEAALPRTREQLTKFEMAVDIANIPRSLVTAFDISAGGRQDILLAARNPKEWLSAQKRGFQAMGSEEGFHSVMDEIRMGSHFEDGVTHGIDYTNIGAEGNLEEPFASTIAEQIPLGVGKGVRASERGFVANTNYVRSVVYEKGAKRLEAKAGRQAWDAARLDAAKTSWAKFVNHATGRGDIGALKEYTKAFNAIFFSPRFLASRPQAIWDLVRPGQDALVRQMVFENLGAFVGGGVTLLGAVAATGLATVELDPRSSDFGKMKVGNQRIDFWGGYQPLARYIAQIGSGERSVTDTGEIVGVNRWKTLGRVIRSKLSPAGALGWDLLVEGGRNYEGDYFLKPDAIPAEAMKRLLPLAAQDAINGYREGGLYAGISAGIVSGIGGGVQTFEPSDRALNDITKTKAVSALKDAGVPFAGNEIDFRQPYLDLPDDQGTTLRQRLADKFEIKVPDDASMSDIRKAYVDQYLAAHMADRKIPEALAKDELGTAFDNLPEVKQTKRDSEALALQYWTAHPELLLQALEGGKTDPSQEKWKIIEDAGLLNGAP